jgi:hypothetical protein
LRQWRRTKKAGRFRPASVKSQWLSFQADATPQAALVRAESDALRSCSWSVLLLKWVATNFFAGVNRLSSAAGILAKRVWRVKKNPDSPEDFASVVNPVATAHDSRRCKFPLPGETALA